MKLLLIYLNIIYLYAYSETRQKSQLSEDRTTNIRLSMHFIETSAVRQNGYAPIEGPIMFLSTELPSNVACHQTQQIADLYRRSIHIRV